MLKKSFV